MVMGVSEVDGVWIVGGSGWVFERDVDVRALSAAGSRWPWPPKCIGSMLRLSRVFIYDPNMILYLEPFHVLTPPPAPTYYPAYNSNARPCLSLLTVPASPFLAVGMDLFPGPWPVPRVQTLTNLNHCRPTAGHGVARNIRPKASLLTGLVQGKTQLILLEQSKCT